MTDRRKVLASLAGGTAALSAVVSSSGHATCRKPERSPMADYFPNVVVQTHENQKALFYNDLLHGKIVAINFMSVKNDAVYPITANLVKAQQLLGDRVGRDIFMYSITVDPEHDTPRMLKAFAEKHGVGPGWSFLTGKPDNIQILRNRLFVHPEAHHAAHVVKDCSMGLVRYGNVAANVWGSFPAKANPEWIAKRFSWVEIRSKPTGPFKRGGPPILKPHKPVT